MHPDEEVELVKAMLAFVRLDIEKERNADLKCSALSGIEDLIVGRSGSGRRSCSLSACSTIRLKINQLISVVESHYGRKASSSLDPENINMNMLACFGKGAPYTPQLKVDALAYVAETLEYICQTVKSQISERSWKDDSLAELRVKCHKCSITLNNFLKRAQYYGQLSVVINIPFPHSARSIAS